MKKIFFFAAAMLAAVSMNAETIYAWGGTAEGLSLQGTAVVETVKTQTNTTTVACIAFPNSYASTNEGVTTYNYAEIAADFKAGDIVNVEFCYNNSSEKVATIGIYDVEGTALAESGNGINARLNDGISEFQYALTADASAIRLARGASGKTKTCITKLEVVRGGSIVVKAAAPTFSIPGGEYHEAISVELSSTDADAIYYRINEGEFGLYSEAIAITEFDEEFVIEAYATKAGAENSETVSATYYLSEFVARPVFKARKVYEFAAVAASDIKILSGTNGTIGTYSMDGKDVPSVNYIQMPYAERDSFLIVTLAGREDVLFRYKNGSNKNNVMKFAEKFTQCDSKNFEIWVNNVQAGDTIVFVATSKGATASHFNDTYSGSCHIEPYQPEDDTDPCYTDGAFLTASDASTDDNYVGWQDFVYIVQEGFTSIRIKEDGNGLRLAKILVGAYRDGSAEGINSVETSTKAIKRIVDGQVVIEKDGRLFNLLGAEIK